MNDLLSISRGLYSVIAMSGAGLLLYVLYLAMDDFHLNRTDRPKVIKDRKRAFFADAVFIALTVALREYWIVAPIVGFVASGFIIFGEWILVVNVISLRDRDPRNNNQSGHRVSAAVHSLWRRMSL